MRKPLLAAFAAAALLTVAGCSDTPTTGHDTSSQSSQESHAPRSTQSAEQPDSQSSKKSDDANTSGSQKSASKQTDSKQTDSKQTGSKKPSHRRNSVTVSAQSKNITIDPTDVYCSGQPGHIHHIIGKTNNGLPLVKAEETHFAMAKIGHSRPYKAENPNGVRYSKNSVTFDDTTVGSAVMNGTMTCTVWED